VSNLRPCCSAICDVPFIDLWLSFKMYATALSAIVNLQIASPSFMADLGHLPVKM
jgi:hypothetical protein